MDIAVTYETDWSLAHVLGVALLSVAAIAWAFLALPLAAWAFDQRPYRSATRNWIRGTIWVIASLTTALTLLLMPGTIMRHLPHHPNVWWVVIPGLLIAGALAWIGHTHLPDRGARLWTLIPAGLLAIGIGVGALHDALTRAAAAIPTTVGVLVLLIIGGLAWLFTSARRA